MPRAKRGPNSRKSRNSGIVSGVTFEVDGLILTHGILAIGSGASITRQSLGLSAIHNVIVSPSMKGIVSGVTGVALVVAPEGTASFGSGCTTIGVKAYKLNIAGVTFTAGVSVNYTAFGT